MFFFFRWTGKRNWRLSSKIQPSPSVGELKPDLPKEVPKVYSENGGFALFLRIFVLNEKMFYMIPLFWLLAGVIPKEI